MVKTKTNTSPEYILERLNELEKTINSRKQAAFKEICSKRRQTALERWKQKRKPLSELSPHANLRIESEVLAKFKENSERNLKKSFLKTLIGGRTQSVPTERKENKLVHSSSLQLPKRPSIPYRNYLELPTSHHLVLELFLSQGKFYGSDYEYEDEYENEDEDEDGEEFFMRLDEDIFPNENNLIKF